MKKILTILTIAIITSSCKLVNDYVKPQKKDIYVLVFDRTSRETIVYKNSTATIIHKDDINKTDKFNPTSMKIIGSDVYIGGYFEDLINNKYQRKVVYFKNGIETSLTDYSSNCVAEAMDIYNCEVKICGYCNEANFGISANYWTKNKTKNISGSSSYDNIFDIQTTKSGTHMVGSIDNKTYKSAIYWKNDVPTILFKEGKATSLAILNNDVHIVGVNNNKIKYWKNGQELDINGSIATKKPIIEVNSKNVCIVWCEAKDEGPYFYIKQWKNGKISKVGENEALSTALQLDGDDVYIGGYRYKYIDNNRRAKATIWKNGIEINIGNHLSNSNTEVVFLVVK